MSVGPLAFEVTALVSLSFRLAANVRAKAPAAKPYKAVT